RTDQVDEVLERLEDALRKAERDEYIATHGQQTWDLKRISHLEELMGRLERPRHEKFRPAATVVPGYDMDEVDVCMARINRQLQDVAQGSLQYARNVTFSRQKGPRGYDQEQVDAFLQAVIDRLVVLD